MIKILLVDDQKLFREALRTLLEEQTDLKVIGEAGDGDEALSMTNLHTPDVILMDLRMPGVDGVTATRTIHLKHPECRVIVLTTFDDDEYVFEGLRAGAVGYLLKDVSSEKLFDAIRAANRGEYFLQPSITAKVVEEFSRLTTSSRLVNKPTQPLIEPLSTREIEVLSLVARGASNKEIADQLFIAEGTVKNHMRNILGKLDSRDRMQAVIRAKELGIIEF